MKKIILSLIVWILVSGSIVLILRFLGASELLQGGLGVMGAMYADKFLFD